MQWLYLIGLVISIGGLLMIDWRHKLAFFKFPRRAAVTIGIAMSLFIIWDLLGIHAGVFFSGGSAYSLPFMIVPDFPIGGLFLLFLLSYVTLLLYIGLRKRWKPTS